MRYELSNVSHQFTSGELVLQNINLTINSGERVAIIGESGAGKTTLKSLLQRDFDPTTGTVLLDGRDLRDFSLSSVKRYQASIEQDSPTISGDVRDNLLFGLSPEQRLSTTDSEMIHIITSVSTGLWKRFSDRGGLDAKVGRYGMELSGGERQRLAIARALLKQPKAIFIDEATSALDPKTEAEVQAGIDTVLATGVTAIIIAHKFATLRQCTKFVCLKMEADCAHGESQIEAICDSFEALYDASETFRGLYDQQRMSF